MIKLKPRVDFRVPVEAECISPDVFDGKSAEEIGGLEILWGNKRKGLSEAFEISKRGTGEKIRIDGDLSRVRHIGAEMSSGEILIKGDVGMHLGRGIRGGRISVTGSVGDWLGAEMRGGLIEVKGTVGDLAGAAYRGSSAGMKGGTIIVHGNAGSEVGELLSGGSIAVEGDLGSFAGALMSGGLITCFGKLGGRAGAGMTNGTILALRRPRLLPTFKFTRVYNPKLLKPRLEELRGNGFPIKDDHIEGLYDRFEGDLASDGKGRVIVWKSGPEADTHA